MKLVLVTDAWQPQVNGVVTTLVELVKELKLAGVAAALPQTVAANGLALAKGDQALERARAAASKISVHVA
jgi:hypothetical protein